MIDNIDEVLDDLESISYDILRKYLQRKRKILDIDDHVSMIIILGNSQEEETEEHKFLLGLDK